MREAMKEQVAKAADENIPRAVPRRKDAEDEEALLELEEALLAHDLPRIMSGI